MPSPDPLKQDSPIRNLLRAVGLSSLSFIGGCDRSVPPSASPPTHPKGNSPEQVVRIPTAKEIAEAIRPPFRGTGPENEKEIALFEEFLNLAATHPILEWQYLEEVFKGNGYVSGAWGTRAFRIRLGDRMYDIHEMVERGYDGDMIAATAFQILDGKHMASDGVGGVLRLYANDDWGAAIFKVLEDRFDLEKKRLSGRAPFSELPLVANRWSVANSGAPEEIPAPIVVSTISQIPEEFRKWKGTGPTGVSEEFVYRQAYNLASLLPHERWVFSEKLSEDFGIQSRKWGHREYRATIEYPGELSKTKSGLTREFVVDESVDHNGQHLVSHGALTVIDTDRDTLKETVSLRVTGGWAEILCSYLETRRWLTKGELPKRVPYITTPTTPGAIYWKTE